MKPLPSEISLVREPAGASMPSIPTILSPPSGSYSASNRRVSSSPSQRIYPWLLFFSTVIAGVFCLMYITKPVIHAASNPLPEIQSLEKPKVPGASKAAALAPAANHLPGELPPVVQARPTDRRPASGSASGSAFEETNLRVQHVLDAEAPGGGLSRIVLDVPVLYQSRSLRWTPAEVAEARELLSRLADFQEKSLALRSEGVVLLDSWNRLVERSIPAGEVRADSPSLPANQDEAAAEPRAAGLDTTEAIQIQPDRK